MRKGADCLSKWVGESERQLRLLFDQVFAVVCHKILICYKIFYLKINFCFSVSVIFAILKKKFNE